MTLTGRARIVSGLVAVPGIPLGRGHCPVVCSGLGACMNGDRDDYVERATETRCEDFEAVRQWVFDHQAEVLRRYACLLVTPKVFDGYQARRDMIADMVEADQCRMFDDLKGSAWVQEEASAQMEADREQEAEDARDDARWGTGNPYTDACDAAIRCAAVRDERLS